jgi:hypothetical protein
LSIRFSASVSPKELAGFLGERLRQLHLPEQRANYQNGRQAADFVGDMFPAPALLTLDVEYLFGKLVSLHRRSTSRFPPAARPAGELTQFPGRNLRPAEAPNAPSLDL